MAFVMFVPSIVCGCLAYWQYERKEWKVSEKSVHGSLGDCTSQCPYDQLQDALIKQRSESLFGEANNVYSLSQLEDYAKVTASGIFLHDKSIFVGPRPRK